jgi:hypothetical protein
VGVGRLFPSVLFSSFVRSVSSSSLLSVSFHLALSVFLLHHVYSVAFVFMNIACTYHCPCTLALGSLASAVPITCWLRLPRWQRCHRWGGRIAWLVQALASPCVFVEPQDKLSRHQIHIHGVSMIGACDACSPNHVTSITRCKLWFSLLRHLLYSHHVRCLCHEVSMAQPF